jgi:pyruvate/2-oxoacid:ferredoxin oxidoreductase beta subunit/Pyruvate/2-oxoacid:ferredoxin oxidoreductase gamma subunit
MTVAITPLRRYRNETPYPFCPGCGHSSILDTLSEALVGLAVDPAQVVIVSDIGCAGLSDQYFDTSAFHGLHGRSITYATGIKLARPELTVIVVMGDGGTGIGGAHLINAARRNIGITVLVFNNLNFGMTGGQHSTTTPEGAVTTTTPGGNLEHPLDICATVGVNGAGYVYRGTSFSPDLAERIVEAVRHPGFALLDVWELCTAYYVPANKFTRRGLESTMERLGFHSGVLFKRDVVEYAAAYREAAALLPRRTSPRPIPTEHASALGVSVSLVVAGSAGAKVRSAARLIGEAAIRSGLWSAQRDDYPVTVKTGHSVSEIVIGPDPITPVGVTIPDVAVIVSDDGLSKVLPMIEAMPASGLVVTFPEFADVKTRAHLEVVDPSEVETRVPKAQRALVLLAATVALLDLFPVGALLDAAGSGPFADENRAAVEAGLALRPRSGTIGSPGAGTEGRS